MNEPEYNPRSIDADLLMDVAECGILGNPVIVVIGEADEEQTTCPELQQNSGFSSLGAVDRVEFIASAIADLQVMLDEIKKAEE
jgi:hypothetical protein